MHSGLLMINSWSDCISVIQALLKMDCQGLVARLVMDFVLLTTAVEVAGRWRELAERLAKVSRQQMEAYEAPHRDSRGQLDSEVKKKTLKALKEIAHRNLNILSTFTHFFFSTVFV